VAKASRNVNRPLYSSCSDLIRVSSLVALPAPFLYRQTI
jgi:hypothetical protein